MSTWPHPRRLNKVAVRGRLLEGETLLRRTTDGGWRAGESLPTHDINETMSIAD
jgi:hypothetical protein